MEGPTLTLTLGIGATTAILQRGRSRGASFTPLSPPRAASLILRRFGQVGISAKPCLCTNLSRAKGTDPSLRNRHHVASRRRPAWPESRSPFEFFALAERLCE